ncbi:hypothetical protein PYCC9005_001651 [Savitreella phatthalungensis]
MATLTSGSVIITGLPTTSSTALATAVRTTNTAQVGSTSGIPGNGVFTTTSTTPTTSALSTTSSTPTTSSTIAATTPSQSIVFVTITSSQQDGTTQTPVIVFETSTVSATTPLTTATSTTSARPSGSATVVSSSNQSTKSGLGTGGTIALAVAIPVGVIAIAALLLFLFYRRRRRSMDNLAARKAEADAYNFNINDGPEGMAPVPAGIGASAGAAALGASGVQTRYGQSSDTGGYRGWGGQHRNSSISNGNGFSALSHTATGASAMSNGVPPEVTSRPSANPGSSGSAAASASTVAAAATGGLIVSGVAPRRSSRQSDALEEPTIPAFARDQLDTPIPGSPDDDSLYADKGGTGQAAGSNHGGKPDVSAVLGPTGAMSAGLGRSSSLSSEYSEHPSQTLPTPQTGYVRRPLTESRPAQPPYPTTSGASRMSQHMPPMRDAGARRPNIQTPQGNDAQRYSYVDF